MRKDSEPIVEITWTVADVKNAFEQINNRQPTEEELEKCIENIDTKRLIDFSIENGWDFIYKGVAL